MQAKLEVNNFSLNPRRRGHVEFVNDKRWRSGAAAASAVISVKYDGVTPHRRCGSARIGTAQPPISSAVPALGRNSPVVQWQVSALGTSARTGNQSDGHYRFETPQFGEPCTLGGAKALCEEVMSREQWNRNEAQRKERLREQARRAENQRRAAESRERAEAPLRPIANTILRDRQRGCADVNNGGFSRDPRLDEVAQRYARAENQKPPAQLNGYGASIAAFLGTGDPEAQAINYAYRKGAGPAIGNCAFKRFGVGFWRIDQRNVDFVAIVLGTPQ